MKLKSTQRKSLATVPSDYQGQERRFAQSVSESLDILTGRRGDIIDRAVTFRDLLDTGVLKLVKAIGTGSTTGGTTVVNPTTDPNGFPVQLPTQPQNFVAAGGFDVIFLSWTLPPYNGHDHVEIYRLQRAAGAAEPTLAQAEAAGVYTRYYGDVYRFTDTNVGSQEQWYYWIRAVNINNVKGPFFSSTGVDATTALDYLYVSGLIDEILDDDVNALGLKTEIDKIDPIGAALGTYQNYTGEAYIDFHEYVRQQDSDSGTLSAIISGTFSEIFPNGSASSSKITELFGIVQDPSSGNTVLSQNLTSLNTTVTGTGGHADQISALRTVLEDPQGNLLSANALHTLETSVGDIEGDIYDSQGNLVVASATAVTDLQTEVYDTDSNGNPILNSSKIQQNISSINGIEGKYSVKVDNNGHVSGFGLVSTANNGTVTAAFIVSADRFAIARPFNSSNTNVSTDYPFKVISTQTTINGTSVPAGVYINEAFIHNAQITTALIEDATITDAKIYDLTATKITSGNIQIDAANDIKIYQGKTSFTSTASGFWLGLNNNAGAFHVGANANKYLKFDGNTGDLITSGLEVRASDGTVLLDAGGLRSADGNNLLYNGGFVHGSDGWETISGTISFNTTLARAYTDSNEAIQSQVTVPVSPQESLYVYADMYGASAYATVIFFKADGTFTSTTVSTTAWAPQAATSQKFRIAKVDYPSYSGNPYTYAKVRFGTLSGGSTTTWHQVGLSKAPPVIDPSYASTFIRDLSVDTLQIAGNAVTVPIGQSNVNVGQYVAWSGTNSDTATGSLWGTAANTGSVGGVTAIPLSWTSNDVRPDALTITACANFLGQSGSGWKTIRVRIVYSTSPSFTSVTQIQSAGASLRTDFSTTLSVNATLDASSLSANQNYYFALQMHGNDQGGAGPTPWKIGQNGISVLAAKK